MLIPASLRLMMQRRGWLGLGKINILFLYGGTMTTKLKKYHDYSGVFIEMSLFST